MMEFKNMMHSEELTTTWGMILGNIKRRVGTIITPPPTPKKEDIVPTTAPTVIRIITRTIFKIASFKKN